MQKQTVRPHPTPPAISNDTLYRLDVRTAAEQAPAFIGPAFIEIHGKAGTTDRRQLAPPSSCFAAGSSEVCHIEARNVGAMSSLSACHSSHGMFSPISLFPLEAPEYMSITL